MNPEQIIALRKHAELTQIAVCFLIKTPLRTYQDWEYGKSRMPESVAELMKIKIAEYISGKM